MKIFKPNWIHHEGNPIFSIDVHPDSSRFATGGQGKDSGKIIIWNMDPVIDNIKENNPNIPKVLCQMDHHIACVNVVRWSNNGFFLASGSDDKLIMIWQYSNETSYLNIENWKCGYTLRGHSGDVLDLAWSPKDEYLVTCSVDNTIIIWDAVKFPILIKRIEAHSGLVKGVTWDPVGEYFASQSDDKTLKIWRKKDWELESSIDEPFKECNGTTHILRLNWSPDGQILISAHAINNGAPTAQVIDRGNKWKAKLDFVGHRKAVTVVRFFPQILKTENTEKDTKFHCLFALGSRDRSVSIWLTNYTRPLCVLQELFDNPVMDLSWSRQTKPVLLACSMDGSVASLQFDFFDVGSPISDLESAEFFKNKYNYDINCKKKLCDSENTSITRENLVFIENPDILLAKKDENFSDKISYDLKSNQKSKVSNNIEKQIERRLPDGRRKITPICISKPGEYDQPKPFGNTNFKDQTSITNSNSFSSPLKRTEIISKTATEKSTIIIEKRDEKNMLLEVSPVKSFTKNYINSSSKNNQQNIKTNVTDQNISPTLKNYNISKITEESNKLNSMIRESLTKKLMNNKDQQIQSEICFTGAIQEQNTLNQTEILSPLIMEKEIKTKFGDNNCFIVLEKFPLHQKFKVSNLSRKESTEDETMLIKFYELKNNFQKDLKWIYFSDEVVCDVSFNNLIVASVRQDSSLVLLKSKNGSLICSPLILDSKAAFLSLSQNNKSCFIMCLTIKGYLYLWKYDILSYNNQIYFGQNCNNEINCFSNLKTLINYQSCQSILQDKSLINAFITENGIPIFQMSGSRASYFSLETRCWHLFPTNVLFKSESFLKNACENNLNCKEKPLEFIQTMSQNLKLIDQIEIIKSNSDILPLSQKDLILAQLEAQLNASIGLKSSKEFRFCLISLIRYLIEIKNEIKLNEICNFFLGPLNSNNHDEYFMDMNKFDILQEILSLIASNLELQRLYCFYKQQLDYKESISRTKRKDNVSVLDKLK